MSSIKTAATCTIFFCKNQNRKQLTAILIFIFFLISLYCFLQSKFPAHDLTQTHPKVMLFSKVEMLCIQSKCKRLVLVTVIVRMWAYLEIPVICRFNFLVNL